MVEPSSSVQRDDEGNILCPCKACVAARQGVLTDEQEAAINRITPVMGNMLLMEMLRECVALLELGIDDSQGWQTSDLEKAQAIVARLQPLLVPRVDIEARGLDVAVQELVDAGLADYGR